MGSLPVHILPHHLNWAHGSSKIFVLNRKKIKELLTNQQLFFSWLTYHCSNSWISASVQHNLFHWMSIHNCLCHIWDCLYTESQLHRHLGKVRIGILQCSNQIGQKSWCHCRQVQALHLQLKNAWYVYVLVISKTLECIKTFNTNCKDSS